MSGRIDPAFWRGKRVLLTGHTGFKGAWATIVLRRLGAEVCGIALAPETRPNLFEIAGGVSASVIADIREPESFSVLATWKPQIVLHMAAQPLVRRSYADPVQTFATNVMGTVNLLEALRGSQGLEAILVVTTDKVYRNDDTGRAFLESDPLGGHDPYSASKAGSEVATYSYAHSFFEPAGIPVATARAGNVIGGGDWSIDRIIPDIWRANKAGEPVGLRMPDAVRPWQHVLDPVAGYLVYCQALVANRQTPRALNFGPPPEDILTVAEVADRFLNGLGSTLGWVRTAGPAVKEMKLLSLDPGAARQALRWRTRLDARAAIDLTSAWYHAFDQNSDMAAFTNRQIDDYMRSGPGGN